MSNKNFKKTLQEGKKGEQEIITYFKGRNSSVIDVSDDKEFQKKDIDLLLQNQENQKCSVEIKTDNRMSKTGNFFFEIGNDRETGYYDGWVKYCQADYICFFDNTKKKGYILDWEKTKAILKEKAEYTCFCNRIDNCFTDAYLLPIGTAKRMNLINHTFSL